MDAAMRTDAGTPEDLLAAFAALNVLAFRHARAGAGQRVLFDVQSWTGTRPYYRIIDPARQLFQDVTPNDKEVTPLPRSGSYLLLVEGRKDATAPSSLGFTLRSVTDTVTPIEPGSVVSGSIASPGQVSRHSFTLAAPTRLLFDTLGYTNSSITWTLTGPRGAEILRDSSTTSVRIDNSDSDANQPWLDLPAGTAVRFEPGDARTVALVALGGRREVYGLANLTNGPLDR